MMQELSRSENCRIFQRYLERHFGVNDSRFLETGSRTSCALSVHRKRSDQTTFGQVSAPAIEDGFLISLSLRSGSHQPVCNGRFMSTEHYLADTVHIRDLSQDYSAYLCSPFDFLFFHISRGALDAVAQESGARPVETLSCQSGRTDQVAACLGRALVPALTSPSAASALFIEQVALALNIYFAQAYGGMEEPRPRSTRRLSRSQERRATEFLLDNVGEEVSVSAVAAECGLSRSYFIKAFKETMGRTPHKWLLNQRIQKAKGLLTQKGASIADIAVQCGFADQSHLTRVFTGTVGVPPGAWRRDYES